MNYRATPKSGIGDSRAAYLDNEIFPTREQCQAEVNRLGLTELYEVQDCTFEPVSPMKPFFPK